MVFEVGSVACKANDNIHQLIFHMLVTNVLRTVYIHCKTLFKNLNISLQHNTFSFTLRLGLFCEAIIVLYDSNDV